MTDDQTNRGALDGGHGGDAAVAVKEKSAPAKRKPKRLPPFKVLLHNDDTNTFEHVIATIVRLTALDTRQAMLRALEAHETGVSLLLTTHKERAELYQEQFTTFSITTTVEPA